MLTSNYILHMKTFLSAAQVARLEQVAPITVVRWIHKGTFPGTRKVGHKYKIPITSYDEWRQNTHLPAESISLKNLRAVRTPVRTGVRSSTINANEDDE